MDEEIIVPFGCSPQVCVEEALLKHTSVEVQESSTYQRYLSIRQEVLLIQDRVNKVPSHLPPVLARLLGPARWQSTLTISYRVASVLSHYASVLEHNGRGAECAVPTHTHARTHTHTHQ